MATETLTSKRGAVTIAEETATVEGLGEIVTRFVVTTPTGYRATLPACYADDCLNGKRQPCAKPLGTGWRHSLPGKANVESWRQHSINHCHGWHAEAAERFARDVLKSFDRWRPTQPTLPGFSAQERKFGRMYVDCPAWPAVWDKPLPALCACESCAATETRFAK